MTVDSVETRPRRCSERRWRKVAGGGHTTAHARMTEATAHTQRFVGAFEESRKRLRNES